MNDNFSIKRYWSFITHYWYQNRKQLGLGLILTAGILLLFMIFLFFKGDIQDDVIVFMNPLLGCAYISICNTIVSSFAFKEYKTKAGRISAMMLPVKKSEKFLGIFTIYVVAFNVFIITFFTLATIILSEISGFSYFSELKDSINYDSFIHVFSYAFPIVIGFIGYTFLMSSAIYFLGSSLWPKMSYLKTFAATYVIEIVLAIIIPFTTIIEHLQSIFKNISDVESTILWIIWISIAIVYTIDFLLFYLAWRRFKSLQLSQHFLN